MYLNEMRVSDLVQAHGLGTAMLTHLRENAPTGTTLRLRSTNIETNNALNAIDAQIFRGQKPPGANRREQALARGAAYTQEVRRLLKEGPREAIPLWAKTLDNAGWKNIEVEVGEDGNIYFQGSTE